MFEKVKELRDRYSKATTLEEKQQIQKETDQLRVENPQAWADAMLECITESADKAEKLVAKKRLDEISNIISISYIAKEYFGKTPQWFYQRLNENIVNGKPATFTEDEIKTLNFALKDISKKIGSVSI
ncbi:DUF5053 domain-containing protein [Capnocytophaga sp. ARDL2]|uniref:DUF5053 domain-containing protein n=1 Tax=Capnocytophaga sp. ARDL2 TaxID=3238809 RepID=UPI003555F7D0